ncbi:MAG: hypothetical protein ACFFG0_03420 [Candidatus Thorarchaeota archaeon]
MVKKPLIDMSSIMTRIVASIATLIVLFLVGLIVFGAGRKADANSAILSKELPNLKTSILKNENDIKIESVKRENLESKFSEFMDEQKEVRKCLKNIESNVLKIALNRKQNNE